MLWEGDILHRNISFNSILFHYEKDPANKAEQGMLIDFDRAASVSQIDHRSWRTVNFRGDPFLGNTTLHGNRPSTNWSFRDGVQNTLLNWYTF